MDEKLLRFEELRLQPGQRLQLDIADYSTSRDSSTLVGYNPGQSIIVMTPQHNGAAIKVMQDTEVTVRFFSQTLNGAGAFKSKVLYSSSVPYAHMHLSMPDNVILGEVRRALRAKVSLATAIVYELDDEPCKVPACITDISVMGARVERLPDGAQFNDNHDITLVSRIEVSGVDCTIRVKGIVRNVSDGKQGSILGVEFVEVDDPTRVLLHGYTLSQMLDFAC